MQPSELICQWMKIAPVGVPHKGEVTRCCYCGRVINPKDLCTPRALGNNFMDHESLAAGTNISCGFCAPLCAKGFLSKVGGAVICEEGALSILSDPNRAWFLLTPPQPPFVVFARSIANSQHLAWKAAVTLDLEAMQVQFGPHNLVIRHSVLLQALQVCTGLGQIMTQEYPAKNGEFSWSHPFNRINRMLNDMGSKQVEARTLRFSPVALGLAAKDRGFADGLEFLKNITDGELWALMSLVGDKAEKAAKPRPINLNKEKL